MAAQLYRLRAELAAAQADSVNLRQQLGTLLVERDDARKEAAAALHALAHRAEPIYGADEEVDAVLGRQVVNRLVPFIRDFTRQLVKLSRAPAGLPVLQVTLSARVIAPFQIPRSVRRDTLRAYHAAQLMGTGVLIWLEGPKDGLISVVTMGTRVSGRERETP